MKIEQFRQDLTTEQLNDTLGKVFGTAIDLTNPHRTIRNCPKPKY